MMTLFLADLSGIALAQFGGRLHPMLLHLPIGLFVGLASLEALALARRKPLDESIRTPLAILTAACAIVTMISGLLLSRENAYGGDALQTHKLLGIGVAVGATLMAACALKPSWRLGYALFLVATLIATIPAGHIGGTMTHGEGFLTEPFSTELLTRRDTTGAPLGEAQIVLGDGPFAAAIAPVINERCLACHSDARRKGGLAMHTADALFAGSEAGPVIVPGDAANSELIIRLRLPIDDKQHMPPGDKPQPTELDIAAIERWINAGAIVETDDSGSPEAGAPIDGAPGSSAGPVDSDSPDSLGAAALAPPSPPIGAIEALRAAQAHVELIDPQRGLLWIDCAAAVDIDDARAEALLTPLLDWIADLSFAGTKTRDGAAGLAARMPHLRSLNLSRTDCTPAAVKALHGHPSLEVLRLTQTKLDDSAIESLASMPALKRVYLWNARISPEAVTRLHAANADVLVDVGVASANGEALETEGAIALSGEAPVPGAAPTGSAAVTLAPVNSACPVSGAAINPKFAIVHEGRVIAFCCQDCAAKFWAEPAKYPLPK